MLNVKQTYAFKLKNSKEHKFFKMGALVSFSLSCLKVNSCLSSDSNFTWFFPNSLRGEAILEKLGIKRWNYTWEVGDKSPIEGC